MKHGGLILSKDKKKSMYKTSGVYVIRNKVNGMVYIGSSKNVGNRWSTHRYSLRNNSFRANKKLQDDFNTYKEESFSFELIEEVDIEHTSLFEREQFYLDQYGKEEKYNFYEFAGSSRGYKASEESKKKMSDAKMKKNASRGKYKSEETKVKMSESQRGERSHRSKLSEKEVIEIKKLLRDTNMLHREIAEKFGISKSTVGDIKRGNSWSHVILQN